MAPPEELRCQLIFPQPAPYYNGDGEQVMPESIPECMVDCRDAFGSKPEELHVNELVAALGPFPGWELNMLVNLEKAGNYAALGEDKDRDFGPVLPAQNNVPFTFDDKPNPQVALDYLQNGWRTGEYQICRLNVSVTEKKNPRVERSAGRKFIFPLKRNMFDEPGEKNATISRPSYHSLEGPNREQLEALCQAAWFQPCENYFYGPVNGRFVLREDQVRHDVIAHVIDVLEAWEDYPQLLLHFNQDQIDFLISQFETIQDAVKESENVHRTQQMWDGLILIVGGTVGAAGLMGLYALLRGRSGGGGGANAGGGEGGSSPGEGRSTGSRRVMVAESALPETMATAVLSLRSLAAAMEVVPSFWQTLFGGLVGTAEAGANFIPVFLLPGVVDNQPTYFQEFTR